MLNLTESQKAAVNSVLDTIDDQACCIIGSAGSGKDQPLSEPILTPSGWVTMGDLSLGSLVIGSNGKPTGVTGIYPQGIKEIFKVHFSDRTFVRCGAEHLWRVQSMSQKGKGKGAYSVKSTQSLMQDYLSGNKKKPFKYSIPGMHALQGDIYIPEAYAIGYALGNGSVKAARSRLRVSMHYDDCFEVLDLLYSALGSPSVIYHVKDTLAVYTEYPLAQLPALIKEWLDTGDKSFPEDFLKWDVHSRYQLLRGLMDSDGTVNDRHIRFSTKCPHMLTGIIELIRSLGGTCHRPNGVLRGRPLKSTGVDTPEYSLPLRTPFNCFSLRRKVDSWDALRTFHGFDYRITLIEPDGFEESQCIAVDAPDQLYVTRDFKLTHNTTVIRHLQAHFANLGKIVVSVAPTNSAAQNIDGHTICRWVGATPYYTKKGELRFNIPIQGELLDEVYAPGDILIVDEAFMVQKEWIAALQYKQNSPQIIFVGDSNQLPPVKESESILMLNKLPKYKIEGSQRFGDNQFLTELSEGLLRCTNRGEIFALLFTIPKKSELYATNSGYTCLSYTNANCDRLNAMHTSYKGLDPVYLGQKLLMDRTIMESNLYAKEEVEVTQIWENSVMLEGKALYTLYTRETLTEKENWRKTLLEDPKSTGNDWSKFYKHWEPYITLYYAQFRTVHAAQGQTMDKVAVCVNDFQKCRDFPTLKRLAYTAVTRSTGNIIAI